MNFQAQRDFSNYNNQYQKVVSYLLDLQVHYPELYGVLAQTPQFEYEVAACRNRIRYARRYLSSLVSMVKAYQLEKKLIVTTDLSWRHYERGDGLHTLNYMNR